MAVAIFDTEPTAGQLLERRLADGWTPTPSDLRTGPEILGHAACLVSGIGDADG